ncbi:hypothetical protein LVY72_04130 [Arthrobacter sp. I2-34]|uniref:Uncharacterized protein n=1 Tax=Arthrobacter hankyongi TaxID=2904801 RepID=A0ABS9L377_9MICC|nr:hypothetical protein [Arthrobacter hankyongi]MCG2621101.1 hypothetical protein [Arthrobacter hankyongi]
MGRNARRRHGGPRARGYRPPASIAAAETGALAPEFRAWFGNGGPQEDQSAIMAYVQTVLAVHRELRPRTSATSFTALGIEAAVCLSVDSFCAGDDYFYMPFVTSMSVFTNFLEQTGRWTGTDEQLQELRIFYRRAHLGYAALGPVRGFDWTEPDQSERLELLAGLPVTLRADRLLAALVTRLRDDPTLPWRQAVRAAAALGAPSAPAGEHVLAEVFTTLRGLGLGSFSGTADQLAEIRQTMNDGDADDRLELLEMLAYTFFEVAFSIGCAVTDRDEDSTGYALGRLLAQAASTTGSVSRLVLSNPGVLVPAGQTEETTKLYAEVGRQLEYLHGLGLVVLGKDIAVPLALRRAVLEAWEDVRRDSLAS